MAVYEVSWNGPKIISCFTSIRKWVLTLWRWRPFWFSWKISLTTSPNWVVPYQSDVLSSWSPPTNFIRPSATGNMKFPFFGWERLLPLHWVFWVDLRCVHRFQLLKVCDQYVTLPNSTPRTERIQGTIQVRLSFQIDGFLTGLSQRQGNTQPMNQTEWLVLYKVLQNVFRVESSHQTRDLECFADWCSIPWDLPIIFHPDLIATIPQTYLLSLCALLPQQSHLFLICVVLTYNDSRKDLHKLFQIPKNCQCKWL